MTLSSLAKQNLLTEFASLQYACPEGLYVALTPGDPTLWAGVLFVRRGPYAPAILRFHISFQLDFPSGPPLLTFSTEIFHPLLTPLTTYTYTTNSSDSDPVSATDEERLPPGGFSLRHGFPHWFGRARRSAASSRTASGSHHGSDSVATLVPSTGISMSGEVPLLARKDTSVYEVLEYLRSAFSNEDIIDAVPLESAANPGAWHAWHAYKGASLRPVSGLSSSRNSQEFGSGPSVASYDAGVAGKARKPGQWNWEGVWEERVKKGLQASLSDPVLFGGIGAGEDAVCCPFPPRL
ncbi:hypothetical protein K402DRAFT_415553 [Aulographum hederae CBS 113979]|uniref:UBC core domain-containing protein n=1 Tax=Aulographum hederae CBS 113979 TaxID=1176131 RepID=A0A6G1GKL0_9PEZI|nr:hypothetical protein K402DRAFT_415553 [Aulographum hederae CBS 113979]